MPHKFYKQLTHRTNARKYGTTMNEEKNITMLGILDAITSGHLLFNSIAKGIDYCVLPAKSLSRKMYYTRLSKLIKADLIERKNGKYVLTLFGNVIYEIQEGFDIALREQMKLRSQITETSNKEIGSLVSAVFED